MQLLKEIEKLKKSHIRRTVDSRLKAFKENGSDPEKMFSELCFCICTANCSAERGMRAQQEIDFRGLPETTLRKKVRELVCRFYNHKTEYIIAARSKRCELLQVLKKSKTGKEAREWIVKSVKGLGYKEASHFLRNIGYTDVAIIDFHIIDLLVKNKIVKKPKTLTKRAYLEVEKRLEELAERTKTNPASLDLYLWYLETGKILK